MSLCLSVSLSLCLSFLTPFRYLCLLIFYLSLPELSSTVFLGGPYKRAYIADPQSLLRLPQCTSRNTRQTTFPLVHCGSCIEAAKKNLKVAVIYLSISLSLSLWFAHVCVCTSTAKLVDCGSRSLPVG